MPETCRFNANRDGGAWGAAGPAFALAALVAASTAAIAARAPIVAIAPATATIYTFVGMPVNLRGLSIGGVHATARQDPQGDGELVVAGEIANLRASETPLPALRLSLRAQDGRELYAWTAPAPTARLGPLARAPFRARLAAPPAGVRDVLVKFVEPGNKGTFTEIPP